MNYPYEPEMDETDMTDEEETLASYDGTISCPNCGTGMSAELNGDDVILTCPEDGYRETR